MGGYPDGVAEADPTAPWNAPDAWEGRTCAECQHLRVADMLDGSKALICTYDGLLSEVGEDEAACEAFDGLGM